MSDHETTLRMSAYYYSFEPTGDHAIDRILSAVACAGSAYHNTEDWQGNQHAPHPEFGGASPVEWIQRAANDAACLAGADALRRGTCGTCRWLRVEPVAPGYEDTAAVCAHESEVHPLHWCQPVGNPETFGCTFHEPTEPTR